MKAKIIELIDRIIGKKGMLWIPAYWMRNILSQILDWMEGVDAGVKNELQSVKSELQSVKDYTQGAIYRFTCTDSVTMTDEFDITRIYPSGTYDIKFVNKLPSFRTAFSYPRISSVQIIGGVQHITSLNRGFYYFANLSSVNLDGLNTSNVSDFSSMFEDCAILTSVPSLNTSNGTSFYSMFARCRALTTIPQIDTSKGTNFGSMFSGCSKLTSIPQIDTSKGTDFYRMFDGCVVLSTIPLIDISMEDYDSSMFYNCKALTSISFTGSINASISFQYSPLNEASIRSVLEACSRTTNTNAKTVSFKSGSTISDADGSVQALINTCTSKGWTIQNLTIS